MARIMAVVVLVLCLSGCASAKNLKTGQEMKFWGWGKAHFEDGSEIESKTPLELPPVKWES